MTPAERAVLGTSQARDLCLSLHRALVGPRALTLVRGALASLSADRIAADPVLSVFRDVTQS